jgi:hypothetical protein
MVELQGSNFLHTNVFFGQRKYGVMLRCPLFANNNGKLRTTQRYELEVLMKRRGLADDRMIIRDRPGQCEVGAKF